MHISFLSILISDGKYIFFLWQHKIDVNLIESTELGKFLCPNGGNKVSRLHSNKKNNAYVK